ncbi:MAG: hypothetical protein RRA35_11455 [Desulfomonilia bacterium]|nr:hypothetical protein [Desulfomonilia bacterium]
MDQKNLVKQMLDLHKTSFDNGFTMLLVIQDQMEKMVGSLIDQAGWLPEEGRKVLDSLLSNCRKGREDFKKLVDDGYLKAHDFFGKASRN